MLRDDRVTNLREVRLLIRHRGELRRLCKLTFTRSDASIYLVPYAPSGRYYFGSHEFAEQQADALVHFKTQLRSDGSQLPHLSLHERGQVHVHVGGDKAGPLHIPPLEALRGEHVASVSADRFSALAPFDKAPSSTGAEQDFVFLTEEGVESGRLALYVNGAEQRFDADCPVVVTLARPYLAQPLYLGVRPWAQQPLGEKSENGVTVISGWDPTTARSEGRASFLYIRGQ